MLQERSKLNQLDNTNFYPKKKNQFPITAEIGVLKTPNSIVHLKSPSSPNTIITGWVFFIQECTESDGRNLVVETPLRLDLHAFQQPFSIVFSSGSFYTINMAFPVTFRRTTTSEANSLPHHRVITIKVPSTLIKIKNKNKK